MKKMAKSISIAVLCCYVLVFGFVATPYFNYRYAREHGFTKWLFFGEIIATAKAGIWPYYALAGFDAGHSRSDSHSDQHYTNSKEACDKAMLIVIQVGNISSLQPQQATDVVELLQAAITEAELVEDSYLQRVHPDFSRRYKVDYIASLRSLSDAIRTDDPVGQISAAARYNSFAEWMSENERGLRFGP